MSWYQIISKDGGLGNEWRRKSKTKVPAHRVVNRIGLLSGKHHFSPPGSMERSLKKEGIKVKNDKIIDFEKHFWDPIKEVGF